MSARRGPKQSGGEVSRLRNDLEDLKNSARIAENTDISLTNNSDEFDKLNTVEQSAASLGVDPQSWKPISFLNNAHYNQLISANMLDDSLARRIEAYRAVATASGVKA